MQKLFTPVLISSRRLRPSFLMHTSACQFSSFAIALRHTQYSPALTTPRSFLRRLQRMILKRIVVFRLLFYGSCILAVGTLLQSNKALDSTQSVTPSYFAMHATMPGQRFKLQGVVKHGSIEIKKGTLENKFILTDFKNDIAVLYKGPLPVAFREGDMATIGGFLSDPKNPSCFIGTSVAANHEISPDKWLGDANLDRVLSMNMIESQEEFEYTKMK